MRPARTECGGDAKGVDAGDALEHAADDDDDPRRLEGGLEGRRRCDDAGDLEVLGVQRGKGEAVQATEAVARDELRHLGVVGVVPHRADVGHDVAVVAVVAAQAVRAAAPALVKAGHGDAGLHERVKDVVVAVDVLAHSAVEQGPGGHKVRGRDEG